MCSTATSRNRGKSRRKKIKVKMMKKVVKKLEKNNKWNYKKQKKVFDATLTLTEKSVLTFNNLLLHSLRFPFHKQRKKRYPPNLIYIYDLNYEYLN